MLLRPVVDAVCRCVVVARREERRHDDAIRTIGDAIKDGSEYGANARILGPGARTVLTPDDKDV